MCKVFQLIQRNQRAGLFLVRHCVQGCTIRAHQAGNHRTGDISANFHFKRAQNRIIQEGTALYNDVLAEIVRRMRTNDFIQCVLDNTDRQTGRDGVNACAVLLRLLDRRVHKYGAARAEVNRMLCKQTQAAKFFDAVSHRARKGLNKRAAAGGARLIQRNIVDTIVGNFKALNILSANINDKINIRFKMTRRLKVRHGLNKTMIDAERIENQRFTIACDGRTCYANAVSAQLIQLDELFSDDINRIALVRAVIVKQNLMVFTNQHQFCCRRAAVNAKICLAAVHRHVFAHDVMRIVTAAELNVRFLPLEQRLQRCCFHANIRGFLQRIQQLLIGICLFRRVLCVNCRTGSNGIRSQFRKMCVLIRQL